MVFLSVVLRKSVLTGMKNETRIHLRLNDRNQSSRVNNDVHVEVGFET